MYIGYNYSWIRYRQVQRCMWQGCSRLNRREESDRARTQRHDVGTELVVTFDPQFEPNIKIPGKDKTVIVLPDTDQSAAATTTELLHG